MTNSTLSTASRTTFSFFFQLLCSSKAAHGNRALSRRLLAWSLRSVPDLHVTSIKHHLQEPCTIEQTDSKVPFSEDMQKELSNPAMPQLIRIDDQKYSSSLANLLSSELVERQVNICHESKLLLCRRSLRILDVRSLHEFFSSWS